MDRYDALLFRRAFVLTDLPHLALPDPLAQQAFARFRRYDFFDWRLYADDCVPVGQTMRADLGALVVGLALNPFDGCNTQDDIARALVLRRAVSENAFLDYLDELSGRFVVFLSVNGTLQVYPDACATRTVFYDTSARHVLVSSHASLIAELMGYRLSDEACYFFYNPLYQRAPPKRLPGVLSPYAEVRMLTPNTMLDACSKQLTRFFPRGPNPPCEDYNALEAQLAALMARQMALLHARTPLMLSLSAGLDTRCTLAACRELVSDIGCFTYETRNPTHIEDARIACDLARTFGLKHTLYRWRNEDFRDDLYDFERIRLRNLGMTRGLPWLNKLYADVFPPNTVHVRSNIAEIAKADLSDHQRRPLTPETLAYLYTMTPMQHDTRVIAQFSQFMERTGFVPQNLYNYDFYDLFEWEIIMSQWHSWLLLESDMVHDTFVPFNNRRLLCQMLSVPFDDRVQARLFFGIIRQLWPELLTFPINGKRYF